MERLAQYWDDLDDLFWAIASSGEHWRRAAGLAWQLLLLLLMLAACLFAASVDPAAGLAGISLLLVLLSQRGVSLFALKNGV